MIRWWNQGRYERECAEFDVLHPLARETWESLQRIRDRQARDDACASYWGEPRFEPCTDGINAITEGGIAIRVKLHIQFPLHCGVAYL